MREALLLRALAVIAIGAIVWASVTVGPARIAGVLIAVVMLGSLSVAVVGILLRRHNKRPEPS
jgi:hypothetical protein